MMKWSFGAVCLSGVFLCSVTTWGVLLDQLTDPLDRCLIPYLDIVEARIEGQEGDLTFVMRMRSALPTSLNSPDDTLTFLWLIDTDRNPDTGQRWDQVGAEFRIAAKIGRRFGGGFVYPVGSVSGGGTGTLEQSDDTIRIQIHAGQIGYPRDFTWCVTTVAVLDGRFGSGNNFSSVGSTVPLPYIPPARIELFPPMLRLSPSAQATDPLNVQIFDKTGRILPNDRYAVRFVSSDPNLATVDNAGSVKALEITDDGDRVAWIRAAIGDLDSASQVLVRNEPGPLPVRTRWWPRDHVGLYMPVETDTIALERYADAAGAADVLETAYRSQLRVAGSAIIPGSRQYLVVDAETCGNDRDCNVDNPLRLEWRPQVPPAGSTTEGLDSAGVSWFQSFQDMGRNFLSESATFRQLISSPDSALSAAFAEGLTAFQAHWTRLRLTRCGGGLPQSTLEAIDKEFTLRRRACLDRLAAWQDAGAKFETLDADILVGILCQLHDSFGDKLWFDLFSSLVPADESLFADLDIPQKQSAWLIAAASASTGQDLRDLFSARYGLTADADLWPDLLIAIENRIKARPWSADNPADLNCDQQVWMEDVWQLADRWLQSDCVDPWWCGRADLDHSGRVDLADLDALAAQWLWLDCPPVR